MRFRVAACVFILCARGWSGSAEAQDLSRWKLVVAAVGVQYDLSGVGDTPGVSFRAARVLSERVTLEVGALFAKPDQQSGPSTLLVPEAQLHYRWPGGRVSPYVGGGGGMALVESPFRTHWSPTLSLAAGTAVRITPRLDLTGELRLRGIERRFTGSTAEWSLGIGWRPSSF